MIWLGWNAFGNDIIYMFGFNSSFEKWIAIHQTTNSVSFFISAEIGLRLGHVIINRSKITRFVHFYN